MKKYRKKPVVVEAQQWWSRLSQENKELNKIVKEGMDDSKRPCEKCGEGICRHGWIETLEGGHIVCPGDWIIKGVNGEYYPCKPDIFEKTYELAD